MCEPTVIIDITFSDDDPKRPLYSLFNYWEPLDPNADTFRLVPHFQLRPDETFFLQFRLDPSSPISFDATREIGWYRIGTGTSVPIPKSYQGRSLDDADRTCCVQWKAVAGEAVSFEMPLKVNGSPFGHGLDPTIVNKPWGAPRPKGLGRARPLGS